MPASRTSRASKRDGEDSFQLTWTAPVEAASTQTFSFAPNVTPVTFAEPPPAVEDIPSESTLFPSAYDDSSASSSPRRQTHGRKRAQDHIPRPPNAFILFRSSFIKSQHVSSEIEGNHGTLSKIVGLLWHNLPFEERQVWQAKARRALADHKRRWPEYSFRPLHQKDKDKGGSAASAGGGGKRKVREVGPRDVKRCEKIANLLASGMKGEELAAAIEEFDRHRVPEIQTRFEAPLTARQYRRSSSAPLPDTEKSKAQSAFMPSSSPKPKGCSSSSARPKRSMTPQPQSLSRRPTLVVDAPLPSEASFDEYCDSASSFSSDISIAPSPSTEYSFSQKFETDSSFDFNGFSFSGYATPVSDSCSPFEYASSLASDNSAMGACIAKNSYAPYQDQAPRAQQLPQLSIQTSSSSLDSWNNTDSPISSVPATPSTLPQSCYDLAAQIAYDQYSAAEIQGFAGYSDCVNEVFQFQNYSPSTSPLDPPVYSTPVQYPHQHQQQQMHDVSYHCLPANTPSSEFSDFSNFQFNAPGAGKFDYAQHANEFDMQSGKYNSSLVDLDPEFSRLMSTLPQY